MVFLPASSSCFADEAPQLKADGVQTWAVRAANFVLVHHECDAGAVLSGEQGEEWIGIVHPASAFEITAGGEAATVESLSVVIVPPGPYTLTASTPGRVSLVMPAADAPEMAAAASNAELYQDHPVGTAALDSWPEPSDGYRLRTYAVDDYELRPDVLGRIFRSRNFMVNVFGARTEHRPLLAPHSHVDHEQMSLSLSGDYVHHARYPWGPERKLWREDGHLAVTSPSAVVFPTQVIHTSETSGQSGPWQLVDIFGPPRVDFSLKPGYVRNADEYPMPDLP